MGSRKVIYVIVIFLLVISIVYFPVVGGEETHRELSEQEFKDMLEEGDYNFSWCKFPFKVDFSGCTLVGADFSNAIFEKEANFSNAVFEKDVTFYNATFETSKDYTRFSGTHFNGDAHFEDTIFKDTVAFSTSIFEKSAYFQRSREEITFQDGANFSHTTFKGFTDFSNVIFNNYANFEHAVYNGTAFFENAKFLDSAIRFNHAEFYGEVYFDKAEFNEIDGYTTFKDVKFEEGTYFLDTTFFENVYFNDTTFGKISHFNFAKFKGDKTRFNNAIFENNVFFKNVTFEKDTIFYGAEFNKIADFSDTSFEGEMNLDNVVFRDNVYFKNTDFGEIEEIKLSATFERMLIFKPKILYKLDLGEFKALEYTEIKANLTKTEFKDVYLSNVNFVDCKWPDDYKIYEETHMNDGLSYSDLEKIYRNIKLSFQNYGDSEMAGYFLYREKEMKREGTLFFKDPFHWALIHLYWGTCGYGERFSFILFWSFGTMVGFALLFWVLGIEINTRPYRLENNFYRFFSWEIDNRNRVCRCRIFAPICSFFSFLKRHTIDIRRVFGNFAFCLLFSITSFSTLGSRYIKPKGNASRWLSAVESLIGAFFIALFIYVFVRKMLR